VQLLLEVLCGCLQLLDLLVLALERLLRLGDLLVRLKHLTADHVFLGL
jgi:hypothetical protein